MGRHWSELARRQLWIRLGLPRETETARAALQRGLEFLVALRQAFLVVVVVLQVPDGRPPVLHQVVLVLGVQDAQAARGHAAQLVVVDAEVVHAPVGQLVSVVQL